MGVGEGLTGSAYALPTKISPYETMPLNVVKQHVDVFIVHAMSHPEYKYHLTKVGCGLAGHKEQDIASLFATAPSNVLLIDEQQTIIGPAHEWEHNLI